MGGGEKNPKEKVKWNKRKTRLVTLCSPVYYMEVDCFPVTMNTENKPDLP